MKKQAPARMRKVCVLSSHAFFVREIQRFISRNGLNPQARQLKAHSDFPDKQLLALPRASVYVVDAERHNGTILALISYIHESRPKSHILVMADSWTRETAIPFLQSGAKGLLTYAEAAPQLARAVECIAAGGYWVPRPILSHFVDSIVVKTARKARPTPIHNHVSRREREILDALLENRSNKQIANELNISERTVKFHVSNLLAKYRVQRRTDLILLGFQNLKDVPRWIQ